MGGETGKDTSGRGNAMGKALQGSFFKGIRKFDKAGTPRIGGGGMLREPGLHDPSAMAKEGAVSLKICTLRTGRHIYP